MSEPLRVLLVGGGTGGHIYPLVALAHELVRRHGPDSVGFVGEQGRMEADLLPAEGFTPILLRLPPANAPRWRKLLGCLGWLSAWHQAQRVLAQTRPQVVVGAGGQVCAPLLLAAARRGLPRVVLEPNAIPGRANRLLARYARPNLVAVLMPAARRWFAGLAIAELGYPIREAILTCDRASAVAALGLDAGRHTLLVFGGSLGSGRINEALLGWLPTLTPAEAAGWQVLHLGGRVNARTLSAAEQQGLALPYQYREYLHEMHWALAAADLVISRAGAMSLAEFTARGLPAVLSPFPAAADDHQTHNAAWMASSGGALVIPDAELTPARLSAAVTPLLADAAALHTMAAASRQLGRPDSAARIVDRIEELAQHGPRT